MVQHRLARVQHEVESGSIIDVEKAWQGIQDHFWLGIGFEKDAEVMEAYRKKIPKKPASFQNSARRVQIFSFRPGSTMGFSDL
ncbi:MAG: hypothetical protein Ct9H90mP8_3680 [Pseudomonadota bacterium]|nr:MAG: hypothetical protein Ct9H90mP8_3680 [Pseudomonadota bacterium]